MNILYQEEGRSGIVKNLNLCGDFPDKGGCETGEVYFTNVVSSQIGPIFSGEHGNWVSKIGPISRER
jgi:hypothetical protein